LKLLPSDFQLVHENIIYHEHENEFDINISELSIDDDEQIKNNEVEQFIDVISTEPFRALS
jgi:hypothetical protein